MNPIPFSWMLLGFVGCFIAGASTGLYVSHEWYSVKSLENNVARLKADNARFRTALGYSTEIDDDNIRVELSNDEIYEAILRKAPVVVQKRWYRRSCPELVANPVCVDADGMREVGRLRARPVPDQGRSTRPTVQR